MNDSKARGDVSIDTLASDDESTIDADEDAIDRNDVDAMTSDEIDDGARESRDEL